MSYQTAPLVQVSDIFVLRLSISYSTRDLRRQGNSYQIVLARYCVLRFGHERHNHDNIDWLGDFEIFPAHIRDHHRGARSQAESAATIAFDLAVHQ